MNKSRLALVIPPAVSAVHKDVAMKESLPHIGIAYLAGNLDRSRHDVRVFDCPATGTSLKKLISELRSYDPTVVGFTSFTQQIVDTHYSAEAARAALPGAVILIGGYHAAAVPGETAERFPAFDVVVRGEGEHTLNELMNTVADGGYPDALSEIAGLCYMHGDTPYKTPERPFIEELDSLKFPAYDLMPMELYSGFYSFFTLRRRTVPLSTGRGCPYHCIFCYKATGDRYRVRKIASVMEEVRRDIRDFNVQDIVITDESFLQYKDRIVEFCETILTEGIQKKVKWICQARVNHADPDVLKLMKRAGCRVICYGIESGDREILKRIKKGITFEQAHNAINWAKQAGILTDTNFIIGHPGDTRETIKRTIDFSKILNADLASFAILVPFPGTRVAEMARRGEGGLKLISDDYSQFGKQVGGAMTLDTIERSELERLHRSAYMKFYLRPSRILKLFIVADIRMLFIMALHTLLTKLGLSDPRRKPPEIVIANNTTISKETTSST